MFRALITIAVALTGIGTLSGFAGPTPGTTPSGRYCAIDVRTPGQAVCANTPVELTAARAKADEAQQAAGIAPRTQVLIATLFDNANFDASAGFLDVYAGSDCTARTTDIDHSVSNLDTLNNRVSSLRSYGLCATRLWSGTGFSGSAYPSSTSFIADSTYVGAAMNDKARSAQFS